MSDTDNYFKQFIRSIQEEQMYSYWYAEDKKTQLMASINIKKKLYKKPSWFSKALSELCNFNLFILDINYKIQNEYLSKSIDVYDFGEREKKYIRKPSYSF